MNSFKVDEGKILSRFAAAAGRVSAPRTPGLPVTGCMLYLDAAVTPTAVADGRPRSKVAAENDFGDLDSGNMSRRRVRSLPSLSAVLPAEVGWKRSRKRRKVALRRRISLFKSASISFCRKASCPR